MKWKLLVASVLVASVATAATYKIGNDWLQESLKSESVFYLFPTDSTIDTVAAATPVLWLDRTVADTSEPWRFGPWRQLMAVYRIDASSADSTDDSVDTRLYFDLSWDGTNWSVFDSADVTDTLWLSKQIDSGNGVMGAWVRLRYDPIAGMRVDSLGDRPYLTVNMIAR